MGIKSEFDIRNVQRHIKDGNISQDDYDKYLETLEDCAEHAVETETKMVFSNLTADEQPTEAADVQEEA